jgi:UDP-N-acetylmuramate--alanine ligase
VIEADESDRSFLKLGRDVAVITNIELDHHSTYPSLRDLEEAFARFAEPAELRVLGPGVELPGAGEAVRIEIAEAPAGVPALRAEHLELLPGRSRFQVEGVLVELPVPGRHNVLNALAALAACRAAGLELAEGAAALADFSGAGRRFEEHGHTAGRALVFDDYAHHPTEVRATLEAARTLAGADNRRLVACFQPHLYSRTRALARDFGRALALADVVVVADVYPARERAEDFPGVSGLMVAQAAADAAGGRPVWWLPDLDRAIRMLGADLGEHDLLVTLGAGDVDRVARELGS